MNQPLQPDRSTSSYRGTVASIRIAAAYLLRHLPILAMLLVSSAVVVSADDGIAIRAFKAPNGGSIRPEVDAGCWKTLPGGRVVAQQKSACHSSPVREGFVDGYRVIVILIDNGTNGEADSVHLFLHGIDGNGLATADLGTIPAYQGDRMDAFFFGGKLYINNEIYLPGEAHCCGSQVVVGKWGIADQHLIFYGFHTFPIEVRGNAALIAAARYVPIDAHWLLK